MSAYDWVECPICQNKERDLQEELKKDRKTMSDERFEELTEELKNYKDDGNESKCTVRHDQEVWLDRKTGMLKGYVSMGCQNCSAEWEHKWEVKPKL